MFNHRLPLVFPIQVPNFTKEELDEIKVEFNEIERHELNLMLMFQNARRRSNQVQYMDTQLNAKRRLA